MFSEMTALLLSDRSLSVFVLKVGALKLPLDCQLASALSLLAKYMISATDIRVGFFLALRSVQRSSKWTTALIIVVMTLTFLNLVLVSGILVGLIEGSIVANRERYTADVFVSKLNSKTYIEGTSDIIAALRRIPDVEAWSARYLDSATLEAGYKVRTRLSDEPDLVGAQISGIDPEAEDRVTRLSDLLVEGTYLDSTDEDQILIGANLLAKYQSFESPDVKTLKAADLGTKVRLTVGGSTREVYIKGILKSKVGEVDQRIFIVDRVLRKLIGRTDYNVDEIAIELTHKGGDALYVKSALVASGADKTAKVQTYEDAQPKFLRDIKTAFALLGNVVGSIGIVVASITIFIVIFVNAITRRKYIGIMKGIGVSGYAIESSYVFQSLFYAMVGTGFGLIVLYGVLVPYFASHPIDFPFSDGILVATFSGTGIRILVLLCATLVAGYVPARIVVKQNTLDAILGR
jgi:ABC-type lipoprotein release transport system permease subunit